MLPEFEIVPFVGALPIEFGATKSTVHGILGDAWRTESMGQDIEGEWFVDDSESYKLVIVYYREGIVSELKMGSGVAVAFQGQNDILNDAKLVRMLYGIDSNPLHGLGLVVFMELGIALSEYFLNHDLKKEDPDLWKQRAITCWSRETKPHGIESDAFTRLSLKS